MSAELQTADRRREQFRVSIFKMEERERARKCVCERERERGAATLAAFSCVLLPFLGDDVVV